MKCTKLYAKFQEDRAPLMLDRGKSQRKICFPMRKIFELGKRYKEAHAVY